MRNKKAFTLIELVSVLVILAILALIVTPLVLNIIRKARTAADKRSIDAYGRSIELAIADYLLDNGTFPTSIEDLYSGDRVECANKGINGDGTIYLTDCTVNGRAVTGYAYGRYGAAAEGEEYTVGQEVRYNNVDYYVIKNSDATEQTVTLLKKTPLSTSEVNQYGTGHVNMYVTSDTSDSYYQQAYANDNFGGMAYYSSTTCGYNGSEWVYDGCTTDYAQSEIKYVVDAWKTAQAPAASEARLLTMNDLTENLGMEFNQSNPTTLQVVQTDDTPSWIFLSNTWYWMSTPNTDKTNEVWYVGPGGYVRSSSVNYGNRGGGYGRGVRPVITISKSALSA